MLTINKVLLAKTCEVCHQADLFDREKSFCLRCQPVLAQLEVFKSKERKNLNPRVLTTEEALKQVQDRFTVLDKKTKFNNRITFIYLVTIAITIFVADIFLFSINPNSVGLLVVLSLLLLFTGLLIIKQKSLMNSALTEEKNLKDALLNLGKIAQKYRRSKK